MIDPLHAAEHVGCLTPISDGPDTDDLAPCEECPLCIAVARTAAYKDDLIERFLRRMFYTAPEQWPDRLADLTWTLGG